MHERTINKAAEAGLIAEVSGGRFAPGSPVRRDQVASFLVRAFELLYDRGYLYACPQICPPRVHITAVHAAPAGDDAHSDDAEYVELRSGACGHLDLDRWYLRDADGNTLMISGENVVHPDTTLRVYTGSGEGGEDRYYAGHVEPIWDDDGDAVTLYAPGDKEGDRHEY